MKRLISAYAMVYPHRVRQKSRGFTVAGVAEKLPVLYRKASGNGNACYNGRLILKPIESCL